MWVVFWVGLACVGLLVWRFVSGRRLIRRWARKNELGIMEMKSRMCPRKTFPVEFNRGGKIVFYVSFIDRRGLVRNAWVRASTTIDALIQPKVEVVWEDEE